MSLYFTKEHEWVSVDGDIATVGITDFAQGQLGDIVFVEVPQAGTQVTQGGDAAVVESVKAASDVYAPVSGEVVEGNAALEADPSLVNTAPEGEGWRETFPALILTGTPSAVPSAKVKISEVPFSQRL